MATRVNAWFMNYCPDPAADTFVRNKKRPSSLWTRAVYYEGLMALYELDPRPEYRDYTLTWANAHHWTPRNGVTTKDADDYCCCQTYIDMYRLGYGTLDHVIEHADFLLSDSTDDAWWWIDAIQMGMPALYKLSRTTGDSRYAEKAWRMYEYTRNRQDGGLRNPVNGLWWRDRDFNPPYQTPGGKDCYWSRGDGWVVAALCRVLDEMNPTDPHYSEYLSDLLSLLEGLRPLQRQDYFWNCSLADSTDFGGKEVTGTSLFIYGYAWCVNRGLLPRAEYEPMILATWEAMVRDCVHPDGMLGYQQGTGKEPKDSQPVTYDRLPDFEDYGVGCFLLCATEVQKLQTSIELAHNRTLPGTRWWWLGSAVDSTGITYQLETLRKAGIGAVEITPIYGVKGNEQNDIPYLSPRWMNMLGWCETEGARLGMQIDMNNGTGWPFGGPEISARYAAKKAVFHREGDSIRLEIVPTRQKVKRAAPGGEGFVLDHFSREAVEFYLSKFDTAFARSGIPFPHTFFNDSYEVYGADWTDSLLVEFERRRGYRLQDHYAELLDEQEQVKMDYRQTLAELLMENFAEVWVNWCHSHGVQVRNQSHGSPANLLDMYAAVDIPEIEGFGLSDFGIKGLRTDTLTRPNYSDLSMLKYPASVAHFYGKPLVTAETFTWLTEHFRTSFSQCKPDFDLMMVAGVNRCYFHGTAYSPESAAWPGYLFYAAMEMNPQNTIWRDAPAFLSYMQRVQEAMQSGTPDNDLLLYLPVYDIWAEYPGRLLLFDIHKMDKVAPRFIRAVNEIYNAGYDPDYVSDRMIDSIRGVNAEGRLIAPSGVTYAALVLPEVKRMPPSTAARIAALEAQGATIIRVSDGDYQTALARTSIRPETMKNLGVKTIRRRTDNGWLYFITNLQPAAVDTFIHPSVTTDSVRLSLHSGESCFLTVSPDGCQITYPLPHAPMLNDHMVNVPYGEADRMNEVNKEMLNNWTVTPVDVRSFETQQPMALRRLQYWSDFRKDAVGTFAYETTFRLSKKIVHCTSSLCTLLDLSGVRESAHVYVNGHDAGTLFCAPFLLDITPYLRPGKNTLRIEVTSLAANYLAEMDRRGIVWRNFKDANIANLKGGKVSYYGNWDVMPCGLNSVSLRLIQPNR